MMESNCRIWLEATKGLDFTKAPRETKCELEIDACTEVTQKTISILSLFVYTMETFFFV